MKKLIPFFAILVIGKAMAQPTITSISVDANDVTHNSFIVKDQINANGGSTESLTEYGSSATALNQRTVKENRGTGASTSETMLTGLSGANIYYRKKYFYGNDSLASGIFQVAMSLTPVLYLKVENLSAKNIIVGANSASATLRAVVKCNASSDTWFFHDYQSSPLGSSTNFVTKAAGIDTVDIAVSGLTKNVTVYFQAQSMSGTSVISASATASFSTISSTGIEELLKAQFKIYPNPVADKVFLTPMPGMDKCTLKLFDCLGRQVMEHEIKEEETKERAEIDCSIFASGTYFYTYEADKAGIKGSITGKLMILK